MAAEEERRKEEERRFKEAEAKRKREEKRLAMEREAEKRRRLKRQQEQKERAVAHYKQYHTKKCFSSWKSFNVAVKGAMTVAIGRSSLWTAGQAWSTWHMKYNMVVACKNERADAFRARLIMESSLKQWKQVRAARAW